MNTRNERHSGEGLIKEEAGITPVLPQDCRPRVPAVCTGTTPEASILSAMFQLPHIGVCY